MKNFLQIIFVIVIAFLATAFIIPAHLTIDEHPSVKINTKLFGIWKMQEDTNYHDYFVVEKKDDYTYAVTYMNRGGDNRTYEHFPAFFSEVNNMQFLNVPYPVNDRHDYILLKVLEIGHNGFDITAVVNSDPTLAYLSSAKAIRDRIASTINDASFYRDTVHLHKKLPLRTCE